MSRLRLPPLALTAAVALALAVAAGPAAAATPEPTDGEPEGPPAESIAIPYLGEATITLAPPWRITGCRGAEQLPDVDVACAADGVKLNATGYDAAWGEHTLTVAADGPLGALEFGYRITLETPAPPEAQAVVLGFPVESGTQTLVPLSLLAVSCTLCTVDGGALVEVAPLVPSAAGYATVTGAHLALRITPGFVGDVLLPVRVTDDAGQTVEIEAAFRVSPAAEPRAGGLHVVVPAPVAGEPLALDLAALTWASDAAVFAEAEFVCSPAVRGLVACADGIATYVGPVLPEAPGAGAADIPVLDQFVVHVVAPGGRQALASVTIVPRGFSTADALGLDLAATGSVLAPTVGSAQAVLRVATLIPDDGEEESVSPLAPIEELLGRDSTGGGGG